MSPPPPARGHAPGWLAPALVAAAAGVAYCNSFGGPFIFDDLDSIAGNPRIRRLWPLSEVLAGTQRPVAMLSFAVNHAFGGLSVAGYHAVNLAIHVAAALALFAILRRTLATPPLAARYGPAATALALAAAALWAAHPLTTQAVTYVVQRAESLAALFYLLTLHAVIRGALSARRAARWYALAVAACALGAATKPLVVSAPVVTLLYDRFFLAGSFRAALQRRGALYDGLAASWVVAIGLAAAAPDTAAGFHLARVTPAVYAATQPGVVLHYLRLAFWPHPLVLDYRWPPATDVAAIVVPALALAAIAGAVVWLAARRAPAGFAGLWFLLVLAPSSSFFPIHDLAFEHRAYLPLAGPVALAVVAASEGIALRRGARATASLLAALAVAAACALTIRRNHDYRSEIAIWSDVVAKRPGNVRGHSNLGRALLRVHDPAGALPHLENAVRIDPGYPEARNNRGAALAELGRLDEAIAEFRAALAPAPDFPDALSNLGRALLREKRFAEAAVPYRALTRVQPSNPVAWDALGNALAGSGEFDGAVAAYGEALRLAPDSAPIHNNLGIALIRQGRREDAVRHFREAVKLRPDFAPARQNLDRALRNG